MEVLLHRYQMLYRINKQADWIRSLAFVFASKTWVMPRFSGAIFGKASTKRSIRVVPVSNCGWEGQ